MRKLKKVLLIDDDDINNFINEKLLKELQIAEKIKVCRNGQGGLDYILKSCKPNELICPEFIILDNLMPVMDGIEFLQHINDAQFINRDEVVILALVASAREEDVNAYKSLGVKEFSYKPLSKEFVMDIYHKYWA